MRYIDTHIHIDGEEFDADRSLVIQRAKEAGTVAMLAPAIDVATSHKVVALSHEYEGYIYPMAGLHPEEVKDDYIQQLGEIRAMLPGNFVGIGEVGLDYYWSREYEVQQLAAFETQVEWACELHMPLMIHCRKAQNEMVAILKKYKNFLCGGVFHCFTGNEKEAQQLLDFDGFVLGIGGVLTFKKSNLPDVVKNLPLERIVLETDAPYMAPVPMRGKRNESAFIKHVIDKMASCYGITPEEVAEVTTNNACRVFDIVV